MIQKTIATLLATIMAFLLPFSAMARGIIRDAETEQLIREYASPIFRVAGLGGQNIQIHLISDKSFNAFVVDGKNMFVHVGAIMNSKTPNQIIGVLAHETGHITGGHLARLRDNMRKAQSASIMLQLLSLAAMVGGAFAKGQAGEISSGLGKSTMMGGNRLLQRHILNYRRIEEASADQAAITFLNRTRQSGKGMLETFEYFADQELAGSQFVDPYLLSHPMARTRIANLRNLVNHSRYKNNKDSQSRLLRHNLVRAKLSGFLDHPRTVMRKYARDNSLPGLYAKAIASKRISGLRGFIPKIDKLIKKAPKNPYFHELKGQFLFEGGLASDAIPHLRRALALSPKANLIRILLAQALIGTNKKAHTSEAIKLLRKALVKEKQSASGYRQLAIAYGRKGKIGAAELASAQAYFYEGKLPLAKKQASRAKRKFRKGSPSWIKADDIISFEKPR